MKTISPILALAGILAIAAPAAALDEVSFGTNWRAQAEHGGYYQAVADGTYEKHGLKVTIVQGGPNVANRARMIAGQIEFYMGGVLTQFDSVKRNVPTVTVSSVFQKDPQILMAHPGQGIEKFDDLTKARTIYISGDGYDSYFRWMKSANKGFTDAQYKPYNFNPGPFIADPTSAQQGYVTSEPYNVAKRAGWTPKVFLIADAGYDPYSTTIETMQKLVNDKPDLVQRFVDATAIGWYNYLYGDNKSANALIKQHNPEMTDDQITYSIAKMKEYGIVISGEAETKGIGCMTDARWKGFYDKMVKAGAVEDGLDVARAYTTKFVCKGVGLDVYKKLAGK